MAHGVCITKQLEVLFANWRRTKCMRFSVMMTACGSVVLVLKIRLHRRRVRTEMNLTKNFLCKYIKSNNVICRLSIMQLMSVLSSCGNSLMLIS